MDFIAPTEELELELVNFCIEKLNLPFGEFWYQWFTTNNPTTMFLHIDCNDGNVSDKIMKNMKYLSFFDSFLSGGIKKIDMSRFTSPEGFDFKYYLHIRKK